MKVAGCLDQGGGATREKLKEAVRIVFQNRNICVLLVYIFGGITRCDEVCAGIKMALEEHPPTERWLCGSRVPIKKLLWRFLRRFRTE